MINRLKAIFRASRLLLGLLLLDLVTKIAAFSLLQGDRPEPEMDRFHFELVLNTSGLGSYLRRLVEIAQGPNPVLLGAIYTLGLTACLLGLKRFQKLTWKKGALGAVMVLVLVCVASGLGLVPAVTAETSIRLLRGAQSLFWCVLIGLAPRGIWRLGVTLVTACAVGNFLSFWYPPYAVVDFIWSPFLHRAFGLQIFNLADLMWFLGVACFGLGFVSAIARRFSRTPVIDADQNQLNSNS
jgi:lipoprotein signal peptidase